MIRKKYCGTAAKAGGNGEDKPHPKITGVPCLLKSATLRMADEKNAYVMVDRATYLFNREKLRLRPMVEGDEALFNPYGIIAVSPYKHTHAKYEQAMALIAWVTSPVCQALIRDYTWEGQPLYHPDAAGSIH